MGWGTSLSVNKYLPSSMRLRIAVSVTGMVLLLILAQAVALLLVHEEMEVEFIDEMLAEQLEYSMQVSKDSGQLALPNTPSMQLYRLDPGEPLPAGLPPAWAELPIGNHEVFVEDREFHLAVRQLDGVRFILSYDESGREAQEKAISTMIILGALVLCGLLLVMVYLLAGRLTRGMETLVQQLEQGKGDGSYVQPGMERELLAVAMALDAAEERQRELLSREQAFNAHLSHELRTPLTAIRTDAELIGSSPAGLPESVHYRAERIIATTDRVTRLAESLLLLARETKPQLRESILLKEVVSETWEGLTRHLSQSPDLVLNIPESAEVMADLALLSLVLRNLLENALRHGKGAPVRVSLEKGRLWIDDQGPGFVGADMDRIFDRFYRQGDQGGHGLGLALVRHACDACGWEIAALSNPAGGARMCLNFGSDLARG